MECKMKRVVVTGMGAVSPFGIGKETLWHKVLKQENAIRSIPEYQLKGDLVKIGAPLPKVDFNQYAELDNELFSRIPEDDDIQSFFLAAYEAVQQSGLDPRKLSNTSRIGSYIADRDISTDAYMSQIAPIMAKCTDGKSFNRKKFYDLLAQNNVGKKVPYHDSDSINHFVSRAYKIRGPQLAIGTACASGNNAIGEAFVHIRQGRLDAILAGGAYNFSITGMIGFTRIGALTTNPDPETACSPFDNRRSGFVMGSGCGVLMLEELEHAKARGANILCEIKGYGAYSDAYRATDPDPEASGATRTIQAALDTAELNPEDIGYVNAHGTSTKMNDLSETRALKNVFGEHALKIPVSSTKSMIGHGIMAAGALEAIVCIESLRNNVVHGTRNWGERDPDLDLDYVPEVARDHRVDHILSNNFGFGGQNASVIFSRFNR